MLISNKSDIWFNRILVAIIGIGVIAAAVNYFHNRSLWLDEAMLALNIVNKSYIDLLKPLDMNQVAPIGFLFIEKTFINLLGSHDWALRIFPLICYIASIPILYLTINKLLNNPGIALIGTTLFSINFTIILYSSQVKQYSSDVLISLIIIYIVLDNLAFQNKKSIITLSIVGAIAIWLSNISFLLLFLIGLYYLNENKASSNSSHKKFIPILCWIISFVVYFYFFIYNHPTKEMMVKYWTDNEGFVPKNILSNNFGYFFLTKAKSIFPNILGFKNNYYYPFVFFLIGLIKLSKTPKPFYILVSPILLHLILAYLKLYPFEVRTALYLFPIIITITSVGLFFVFSFLFKLFPNRFLFIAVLFPFLLCFNLLRKKVPIEIEEIKHAIKYYKINHTDQSKLYIYYGAFPSFSYYVKTQYSELKTTNTIIEKPHRKNWNDYAQQLVKDSGTIWMIFSHVNNAIKEGKNEEQFIIDKVNKNGFSVIQKKSYPGASCYEIIK